MENKSLKTFIVPADDCQKIVKNFPDAAEGVELEFFTTANVKAEGKAESMSYSVYFCNKIRETFGLNVSVFNSYR